MTLEEFLKSDGAKEFVNNAKPFKNIEEAMAFAKDHNIDLTEDEALKFVANSDSKQKLSEDELDKVTGGQNYGSVIGDFICPYCNVGVNCIDGKGEKHSCGIWAYNVYQCPSCQRKYDHVWDGDYWRDN